ncbi:hypothetical protein H0G86_002417 [Trichoderma simmonsii]|uniref:DUF7580 domain-containing protein n=1 Tax=Trichoderma simmonsii TaxID=1491479 RepID=A0A8G0PFY6_9HYPO|nr:hypothetical protein H0G86_002417 [Trichoderma simmonsii]
MSTFEAFGIVLRAIPILIEGADLGYDKGKLALGKRKYVGQLASALLMQRQTVSETVRLIITRSGYSYDETLFDKGPLVYFQNTDIQTSVEAFLGDENYKALTASLRDMQTTLKEVAKHLDGLIPSHKNDPYDLIGIIDANQTAEKRKPDLIPRLKVALKSSEVKQTICELDKATDRLSTFSQTVLMNRDGPVSSLPSSKTAKLAKAFRRIQKSSKNLYTALCRCCIGSCHNEHDVHVLLEDRIDVASKLLFKEHSSEENEELLAFQLIFAARLHTPIQIRCHELSVKCMQEDESDDSPQTLISKIAKVRVCEPAREKSKFTGPFQPSFVPIDNFCAAVVTAHDRAEHVAFILHASNRMGVMAAKEKTIIQKSSCKTITLKDVLSLGTPKSYGERLPPQSGMLLASKLASSLLQFSQTGWYGQSWSKSSVLFLLNPVTESRRSVADFDRPFVCAKIEGIEANESKAAEPKSILLEFGILLLEIWHQTVLEDRFTEDISQISEDYFSRLSLAAKWLHDDYNPLLPFYDQAVRYCIYGASTKRWTDWNTNELWNEICKEVIEPLSKNCGQWKGNLMSH